MAVALALLAVGVVVAAPARAATGGTLFGASVYTDGRTWTKAVAASDATYGGLDVVRVFYSGAPKNWPGSAGAVNRPVVVSFKDEVKQIAAGKRDDVLRKWFKSAPKDRRIWWSLHHEPEDDIEKGAFTAAQYRDAFRRASKLADEAKNPNLQATLILMNWTTAPGSGRNWRDYYPGDQAIDVIAVDTYNHGTAYNDPAKMLAGARKMSAATGKPWGVAEFGSSRMKSDASGKGRAAWLHKFADYARTHGAVFVNYWDSVGRSYDYRLTHDAPSRSAWRAVVTTKPNP